MIDVEKTIISQYAESPTLVRLVQNMNQYIDPSADFDTFYQFVWNVDTAQDWGLDIWGRIVNVERNLTIPQPITNLGHKEAYTSQTATTGVQPFGQAPFYNGPPATTVYRLADEAYRTLILVKALANISNCTAPSLNQLLQNLFADRGRCFVIDAGKMEMMFVFEFSLLPYEIAIMTQSGAIPRPAAVLARVLQVPEGEIFGFKEGQCQPFGSGVFFSSTGIIDAI